MRLSIEQSSFPSLIPLVMMVTGVRLCLPSAPALPDVTWAAQSACHNIGACEHR